MVGRAALISFPSSLSLMRYTDPISYSAFLSTRAQKWLEGMLAKTVWPLQWVRHHTAGAEGPLPLCLCLQHLRQRKVRSRAHLPTAGTCVLRERKGSWPTFAAKSQPCRHQAREETQIPVQLIWPLRCSCCCFSLWLVPWSLQVFGYGHFPVKLVVC